MQMSIDNPSFQINELRVYHCIVHSNNKGLQGEYQNQNNRSSRPPLLPVFGRGPPPKQLPKATPTFEYGSLTRPVGLLAPSSPSSPSPVSPSPSPRLASLSG